MIYAIGTFVAFFLALLALTKKGRNIADVILGMWLVVIGLHFSLFYLSYYENIYAYPHLLGIALPFPFLHGPLLYLYTQALTNPERFRNKVWALHFILPFLVILSFLPFYSSTAGQKIQVFTVEGKGYETQLNISGILLVLSGVFYVVFTYRLLQNHQRRILNQFSNQEKINLNWLRFLFYGMTVLWFVIIFIGGDQNIFPVASIFIFLIGYFGIKQVGIFTNLRDENKVLPESPAEASNTERKKYTKSGLSEDSAKALHERLTALIQAEKPYLNPELTLSDLADLLQVHSNYLSQVINEMEGLAFYDYINKLRIAEFIREVQKLENQRFTLVALAYDCGFNSKTSFNRNFKKITKLSPTEYLKQLNIVLE